MPNSQRRTRPTEGAPTVPNIAAQLAADAIQRSGAIADPTSINYILVYKANANGFPGTLTSMPNDCSSITSCVKFTWVTSQSAFRYASGTQFKTKGRKIVFALANDARGFETEKLILQ